jgi:hypothetical protein
VGQEPLTWCRLMENFVDSQSGWLSFSWPLIFSQLKKQLDNPLITKVW